MARLVAASMKGDGASSITFLVAPLNGAFPFTEVDDVAMGIRHHLNLDVAGLFDELLGEYAGIAEAGSGLVRGALEAVAALRVVAHHPHALAARPRRWP